MGKILIWSRMTQYDRFSAGEILVHNKFASNTGNLLFTAGTARTVMTEGTQIVPFYDEDVDRLLRDVSALNGEYECAVIPLANAFRRDYIPKLRNLTRFIRSVNFPCYVLGVGMQAHSPDELAAGFAFDGDVRNFVSAVLEKSALLGVRGEFTGEYLKRLGFVPGEHFMVIGCPSAYLNGPVCRAIQPGPFEDVHRVSIHSKPGLPGSVHRLVSQCMDVFDDVSFITQDLYELWSIYFSYRFGGKSLARWPEYYPVRRGQPLWNAGRVMGFLRARDWVDFQAERDFVFGSRIHGTMSAILAGVPALNVVSDLRIRELAEYHGIPHVLCQDVSDDMHVRELYEKADYGAFERKYAQNFTRYKDFLNQNGIRHIYGESSCALPGTAPYDRAVAAAHSLPCIHSGMRIPPQDYLRRAEMQRMRLKYKINRGKLK